MAPLFTILLPIVRPPLFLPFAIESVLGQGLGDFELLVLCDGAPPETMACAEGYARRDPRVKVFAFPKGERNGEAHRHRLLAGANGRLVAHIADDDLWLPNHLEEMAVLLSAADFGNILDVAVRPDGSIGMIPDDIGLPQTRRRMLAEKLNAFGLTFAGYRLAAYHRLPDGWTPAPPELWSDLHMWRKFLRVEGLTFASRAAVTALQFAKRDWSGLPVERQQEAHRLYSERIRDLAARSAIVEVAWRALIHRTQQSERQPLLRAARASLGRLYRKLDSLTGTSRIRGPR
jgi:succinoglycan biosynthesis protein ExoW